MPHIRRVTYAIVFSNGQSAWIDGNTILTLAADSTLIVRCRIITIKKQLLHGKDTLSERKKQLLHRKDTLSERKKQLLHKDICIFFSSWTFCTDNICIFSEKEAIAQRYLHLLFQLDVLLMQSCYFFSSWSFCADNICIFRPISPKNFCHDTSMSNQPLQNL